MTIDMSEEIILRAEQSRAEQSRAEQSRAEQSLSLIHILVTKDVPDYCVAVGSPTRVIKNIAKTE